LFAKKWKENRLKEQAQKINKHNSIKDNKRGKYDKT